MILGGKRKNDVIYENIFILLLRATKTNKLTNIELSSSTSIKLTYGKSGVATISIPSVEHIKELVNETILIINGKLQKDDFITSTLNRTKGNKKTVKKKKKKGTKKKLEMLEKERKQELEEKD